MLHPTQMLSCKSSKIFTVIKYLRWLLLSELIYKNENTRKLIQLFNKRDKHINKQHVTIQAQFSIPYLFCRQTYVCLSGGKKC